MSRSFVRGDNDVAIVGMAGRFPAARTTEELWENLREGREAIRSYTDAELLEAGVPQQVLDLPNYVKAGAPLDDMELFDAGFFGFSPKDAAVMDPQHRHLLECAWEAFENASIAPRHFDGAVGVFVGSGHHAYFAYNLLSQPELMSEMGLFLVRHTSNDKDFLATRISYCLDLRGPSINVQTACSTSLVAVHMACQSLLNGECDLALAGGVTVELPHRQGYLHKESEILSPDGHCRAFDAASQGTVFGSGAGALVLRRLEEAVDAGDHIHAVIRASAINNDGANKVGYLAPSVDGHAEVVEEALELAQIPAESIGYLEAHGTGTEVGDPIEVSALTQAFRQTTEKRQFCALGSVKTNIGHLDTAAGAASLIKVIHSLQSGELVPSLGYESPNPMIDFESSPFFVNTECRPWSDADGPRRAGVSALGVGGTNAHVIVEEWPEGEAVRPAQVGQLLLASGRSSSAARETLERITTWATHPGRDAAEVADGAFTTQVGREHFEHRAACVVGLGSAPSPWSGTAPETEPQVVLLFPGGGAQYAGMGRGLAETEPTFRDALESCLSILERDHSIDLRRLILEASPEGPESRELEAPELAIPALFSVEYALARLLESFGVKADALLGHSMGEYTAACLAGVFTLEEALHIVVLRGQLFAEVERGSMRSVGVGAQRLQEEIDRGGLSGQLSVAAANAPELSVASGEPDALRRLAEQLTAAEIESRPVHIDVAAHSHLLDVILERFRSGFDTIDLRPPLRRVLSNVTGGWLRDEDATSPDYWVRHLRGTVAFASGVETVLRDGPAVFVEVGPGTTLGTFARMSSAFGRPCATTTMLRHPKEPATDRELLLRALGQIWTSGASVDWHAVHHGERRRIPIPTYAWDRQRYWIEALERTEPAADSLTRLADTDAWLTTPTWEETPRPASAAPTADDDSWLIFLDGAGLGDRIADTLEGRGDQVVRVQEGDAFFRESEKRYRLPPELGLEAYRQLMDSLEADDLLPTRVLHAWCLTTDQRFRRASNLFHHHQERGFGSLLRIIQATSADLGSRLRELRVLANDFLELPARRPTAPEKATLMGPLLVAPNEYPGLRTQLLNVPVDHSTQASELARWSEKVLEEIDAAIEDAVVALEPDQRLTQRLQRADLPERELGSMVQPGATVLLTGGLGDLALEMAHELAKDGVNLVLVSRSAFPEESSWDRWLDDHFDDDVTSRRIRHIRRIREEGAEVAVEAADVADIEGFSQVVERVRQRFGGIDGVIHAAGVTDDQPILQKTPESLDRVLGPKIQGTLVLAETLADEDLDFLVLFGSTSAWLSPAGQVDYAAAAHFLNSWAAAQNADVPTLCLNWGAWAEVGLATRSARHLQARDLAAGERRRTHDLLLPELQVSGATRALVGTLAAEEHWMLDDHRLLDGTALLPGTGHVEVMLRALRLLGEPDRDLEKLSFLSPITLAETDESVEMRVLAEGDGENLRLTLATRSADTKPWVEHSEALAVARQTGEPEPVEIDLVRDGLRPIEELGLSPAGAQAAAFRFGERWQVLRSVRFGDDAVAELRLDAAFAADTGDYLAHPALLDLATGFAMQLAPDYDPEAESLVPLSYGHLRLWSRLPASLFSRVRLSTRQEEGLLRFDAWIVDGQGQILAEVEELAFRRLPRSQALHSGLQPPQAAPQITPSEQLFLQTVHLGIKPAEGRAILRRVLARRAPAQLCVSPFDLADLAERAEATRDQPNRMKFERPQLESQYEAPKTAVEKQLAAVFEDLLGVDEVGVDDNFFDLGGHSLVAVRLFARIKRDFGEEHPLSLLFDAPTVRQLAERVGTPAEGVAAPGAEDRKLQYVVALHRPETSQKQPMFIVSGMLGNVLNLRYLSSRLGEDQQVYALQARGLYGEAAPHRRFEDMASDYLAEVRQVQPHGPYFLGGFSGGGLIALEMARMILDQGERVGLLAMLDTPAKVPAPSWKDRLELQLLKWKGHGPLYPFHFLRQRLRWERDRLKERASHPDLERSPAVFRSAQIEEAFIEALERYEVRHYPGQVHLFRPALDERYRLSGNRTMNDALSFVRDDNHWRDFADSVQIIEVPGEHNSMVLEPHVRVLANRLRETLVAAQAELEPSARSSG